MISKLQTKAVMRYSLGELSIQNKSEFFLTLNSLKLVWDKHEFLKSFRPYAISSEKRRLTPKKVKELANVFRKEIDVQCGDLIEQTFQFGPRTSYLWNALESADSGRVTVSSLAIILGCSELDIRKLCDLHWILLMKEIPEISFHILAYYLYRHQELKTNSKVGLHKNNVIDIGTLCLFGNIKQQLEAYNLELQDFYDILNAKTANLKKDIVDCPRIEATSIFVETSFGEKTTLGNYLNSNLKSFYKKRPGFVKSDEFLDNNISNGKYKFV